MANQPLLLEPGEHSQRSFDGSPRRPHYSSDPKIDNVKNVEPEISEIVMNGSDQFLTRQRVHPRLVRFPASAHFGYDHEGVRVGMDRLPDNLIGHVRTVEVAGVDMVHANRDGLS